MLSDEYQASTAQLSFRRPQETIGDLDAGMAARVVAASSDIAMVIDREGVIRDLAVSAPDMPLDEFAGLVERRWVDTVTVDSRRKVEEMLSDAAQQRSSRWREVNQQAQGGSIPFRYVAVETGRDGGVIALGRDLRSIGGLQQRLLQAQQEMERNYARLRQVESRYRALFQMSSEAVLIVDPASRKVVESNPAAGQLLRVDFNSLGGKPFQRLFHDDSRDVVAALVADTNTGARSEPMPVRLADGRSGLTAAASLFRHDGAAHLLISLAPAAAPFGTGGDDGKARLLRILNHIPDAFVVTDDDLAITDVNLAFLELTQIASAEAAKGQPLARFLGRPGVDLRILLNNLRDHGWVRNFASVCRTVFGDQEEVELSAVSAREGLEVSNGFIIRPSRRVAPAPAPSSRSLPRTAEQLTQLVGKVSLREIVAETTDVIEQMCIQAALDLTNNNRVYAAEVLGLSRQSLYSKLKRHGGPEPEGD